MKKVFLLVTLLCCYRLTTAQVLVALVFGDKLNSGKLEFGLMGGPVISDISNGGGSKSRLGLNLGMYFDIRFNNNQFAIHPEIIVKSALGAKGYTPYPTGDKYVDSLFQYGSLERKFKCISIPIMFRMRVAKLLYLDIGPQLDWMVQAKDHFKIKENGSDAHYFYNINPQITMLDIGMGIGLAYRLKQLGGLSFGARYYKGFTDIEKVTAGSQKNSAFMLNVYLPIGAAKMKVQPVKS